MLERCGLHYSSGTVQRQRLRMALVVGNVQERLVAKCKCTGTIIAADLSIADTSSEDCIQNPFRSLAVL